MKMKLSLTLDEELVSKINKLVKRNHSTFAATVNSLLWQVFDLPNFLGGHNMDRKKLVDEVIGRLREKGAEVNL